MVVHVSCTLNLYVMFERTNQTYDLTFHLGVIVEQYIYSIFSPFVGFCP
jgi:hypothetical protein